MRGRDGRQEGLGTGFVVSADGLIASATVFTAFKYYDMAKGLTALPGSFLIAPVMANKNFLKSLGPELEAMVREGINAYKSGRKDEARALLLKATELDQYNEQAWLWLSGLMDTPADQRTCLENVLAINPDNERAKQGLSYLTGQTSAGNASPLIETPFGGSGSSRLTTAFVWSWPIVSKVTASWVTFSLVTRQAAATTPTWSLG